MKWIHFKLRHAYLLTQKEVANWKNDLSLFNLPVTQCRVDPVWRVINSGFRMNRGHGAPSDSLQVFTCFD